MRAQVVVAVGAALHVPLLVMTAAGGEWMVLVLTGPSLAAAAVAAVGAGVAGRRPRLARRLVLVPAAASLAWVAFLGIVQPQALMFFLGVPLLLVGGWMMPRHEAPGSPMPELPA